MSRLRDNSSSAVNFFFLLDIFTCTLGIMILVTMLLTIQNKPKENTVVLPPGKFPPEVELDRLTNEVIGLLRTNAVLASNITWATTLQTPQELTSLYQQFKFTNAFLNTQTNILAREAETTSTMVDNVIASMGLTNAASRIADLEKRLTNTTTRIHDYQQTNTNLTVQIDQLKLHPHTILLPKTDKLPILVTVSQEGAAVELFGAVHSQNTLSSPVGDAQFVESIGRFKRTTNYVVFFVRPSGISLFERLYETAKMAGFEIGYDAVDEDMILSFAKKD